MAGAVTQVVAPSLPALGAVLYQAAQAAANASNSSSSAAASANASAAHECFECAACETHRRRWVARATRLAHVRAPAPTRKWHLRAAPVLGGGARPLPLPPAAEDAKGPSESERYMTNALVWLHWGSHTNENEPFYDVAGGIEEGVKADRDMSDEGLEHKDSRGGVWEVAGDPRDRASFQFGPLSTDCKKVAQERFWSVVGSHWDFWLPFSLTAYVFAPFMGVMFYCMLKGSKFFGDCLDRVTTGADIKSVLLRMYKGRPDPWAGRAPEENK